MPAVPPHSFIARIRTSCANSATTSPPLRAVSDAVPRVASDSPDRNGPSTATSSSSTVRTWPGPSAESRHVRCRSTGGSQDSSISTSPSGSSLRLTTDSSDRTGTWFCHNAAFRADWNRATMRALGAGGGDATTGPVLDAGGEGASSAMTSAPGVLFSISPCLLLPLSNKPYNAKLSSHVLSNFRATSWPTVQETATGMNYSVGTCSFAPRPRVEGTGEGVEAAFRVRDRQGFKGGAARHAVPARVGTTPWHRKRASGSKWACNDLDLLSSVGRRLSMRQFIEHGLECTCLRHFVHDQSGLARLWQTAKGLVRPLVDE